MELWTLEVRKLKLNALEDDDHLFSYCVSMNLGFSVEKLRIISWHDYLLFETMSFFRNDEAKAAQTH